MKEQLLGGLGAAMASSPVGVPGEGRTKRSSALTQLLGTSK